ncbi:hypothetical protein DIURU_004883 [Diutina rugosa]|uniref:MHD domain-containing protein n=1 Tax=Diutina rugosa TaxID=5481 RepID=A0A642UFG3_DIURU|nr:uncharacterized protein DIURU_004883 [Diutina rugosa]KAA8898029.1 hypothetical protein DIURU_004883 [Diutina rugosa]
MITALFMYDSKGDVIVAKTYKEGVKRSISEVFRIQIITSSERHGPRSPVLTLGSTSFVYIRSGSVWICAVTRSNQDCGVILEFLYKFNSLVEEAVGTKGTGLEDEALVNNFVMIHEVLDEVIEFGFPTNLEPAYVSSHVQGYGHQSSTGLFRNKSLIAKAKPKLTSQKSSQSSSYPWRPEGIKYRRNEIYLDVSERINALLSEEGEVLQAFVDGKINMKTHLSGMPECQFGFNDDSILLENETVYGGGSGGVVLEDSKFHQCVQLTRFSTDRTIRFVPPDGEFTLMSYNCRSAIELPFSVTPVVRTLHNRLMYTIRIKAQFSKKLPAIDVVLRIPTPKGVIWNNASASGGRFKYHPEENVYLWRFPKFFGEDEHEFRAEVEVNDSEDDYTTSLSTWSRPPMSLEFKLEMYSSSGLSVRYLRVSEKASYRTVKWVKYETEGGKYQIRY